MMNKEQVEHIASLAKLKFSEEEIDGFATKFIEVLNYVDTLNEIEIESVEPTYQVNDHIQLLREDVVEKSLTREEVLQNTKESQYGYFKLLKVVE